MSDSIFDAASRARRGIVEMDPYIPGKPIRDVQEELGLAQVTKLASNECPLPLPQSVVQAITARPEDLSRYPDGNCTELRRALAAHLDLPPEYFVFGNGAEECIRLIAQAFLNPEDTSLLPDPIFDAYETATTLAGASTVKVPLDGWKTDLPAMLERVDASTKIVWLCNPANPMGTVFGRSEFQAFLDGLPQDIVVVLDQAYMEFVDEFEDPVAEAVEFIKQDPRVVGIRTFSKAYGLAGLRVGYIMARPEVVAVIRQTRLPFNVSVPAQAAALAALGEQEFVAEHVALVREQRVFLAQALEQRGLNVIQGSQTNFLLAHAQFPAQELFKLLLPRGFIIRPMPVLGSDQFIRVSTGTRQENLRFLAALDEALGELALSRQP